MRKIIDILAVLLVGSITAVALCYDKPVPDPNDQNITYTQNCDPEQCGGTCAGTVREQKQTCDTAADPTGKFCSVSGKDVKLSIFIGQCGTNNAGVCDCLNKVNTDGGTVNIATCQCVSCGG